MGRGNSTPFNLIIGNIRPDTGMVHFDGRDVTRFSPIQRRLAGLGRSFRILQSFGNLTVFENLLVAATLGTGRSEVAVSARCAAILGLTKLIDQANLSAGSLSLLGHKRLKSARAVATSPKLFLLGAAGLSLVFGIMRLVNLAHGDLIIMAANLILLIFSVIGINPLPDDVRTGLGIAARGAETGVGQ